MIPRPSKKAERRKQLVDAFEKLLATQGYEGATMMSLADEAGLSPGLVHHYFRSKEELVDELLASLVGKLRLRAADATTADDLVQRLLRLGPGSDPVAAGAWVGLLAEAMKRPAVRIAVQRALGRLLRALRHLGDDEEDALATVAMVVGFLVIGAIHPEATSGRAAAIVERWRETSS